MIESWLGLLGLRFERLLEEGGKTPEKLCALGRQNGAHDEKGLGSLKVTSVLCEGVVRPGRRLSENSN